VTSTGGNVHFATDFCTSYRARRAQQELQRLVSRPGQKVTTEEMIALQSDSHSLRAELIVPLLLRPLRCAETTDAGRRVHAAELEAAGVSATLYDAAVARLGAWDHDLAPLKAGGSLFEARLPCVCGGCGPDHTNVRVGRCWCASCWWA
jgi:acyl-homoserine lactone acylase PvdQ